MTRQIKTKRSNRSALFTRHPGQAIVLIALVMVALLGFTALAIDGGQLYFLQRDAQNAADAALVAALYELCKDPEYTDVNAKIAAVQAVGESAAIQNGFDDDVDNVSVTVNVTPSGDPTQVEVLINAGKPAQLVQVVYNGPLEVTVRTTGRCKPGGLFSSAGMAAFGGAIGCADAVKIMGSGHDSTIEGGMHSNSDMALSGLTSEDGTSATGTVKCSSGCDFGDSSPQNGADIIPMPDIWYLKDFQPGGRWAELAAKNNQYFYYDGSITELQMNADGTPKQGIHYASGNMDLKKSTFDKGAEGVTLVTAGMFSLTNKIEVLWSVYDPPNIPPLPLVFANYGDRTCNVNKGIDISSAVMWRGVLYAPNGQIKISFSAGGAPVYGCVVGHIVEISPSQVELRCVPELFPPVKPMVSISD